MKPQFVVVMTIIVLAAALPAAAQLWIENGDAGSLPGQEQFVTGNGPLFGIQGQTSAGDDVDLYLIDIVDPDQFVVATNPEAGGFADFDTQLFIFDPFGLGVAANDDCPFVVTTASCIADIGPAGQGLLINPGPYLLAVTGFDHDPGNFNGQIFDQNPNNEITGPDGPGGFQPIEGWNNPWDFGNYNISIQGVDFFPPPPVPVLFEPGTKHTPPAAPTLTECQECPDDNAAIAIDPVYLFSGEYYLDEVDLRIPGRGFDFVWARKYRSRLGPQTEMGNGWDHSYNLSLAADGPDLVLCDGHSRADLYTLQPDGTWTREEFFRTIEQNPDNTFTVTLEDTGAFNFNAFDGSPAEGKIGSIVDRNGNTMTFDYNLNGRLVTIHDTLDTVLNPRTIDITYNLDGLIQSVTDFAGRSVSYDYYNDGDAGGSAGDLKSVTSPVVGPTVEFPIPAGHQYPGGKTTIYTYTTGFADETLNHDLLTITDPKGQVWLTNIYAHTIDPLDPRYTEDPFNINYDRVVRQIWGDPGDIVDVFYLPVIPDVSNNFAVIETIVNDRVGNVKEFFYDQGNRGVMERIHTGRAPDPDVVTTDVANRPTGKLRPGDPEFYETLYEHSNDSLPTRTVHPNGNEELFVYDVANADRRSQGNLLQHQWVPGVLGGDQVLLSESFEYDDGFGSCCGTNFVTTHTDRRGNVTTHLYDSSGNRTHSTHRVPSIVEDFEYNPFGQMTAHVHPDNGSGQRRRDEMTYYAAGPQTGYMQDEIIDATGFALAKTYEYDLVGNITRITDPRGNDTQYVFNQLNQVVRETSREVIGGSGVRYDRDTYYDANDNVVRVDIENVDDQGVAQANTHFSTIFEYDILNYRTRACREVGTINLLITDQDCSSMPPGDSIVNEFEYDDNRNMTLTRHGEATNGNQPTNIVRTLFDERDLVFQVITAQGDAGQSTAQFDYDGNKNRTIKSEGLQDTPRITTSTYDGYDRLVSTTDPMGNVITNTYDANDNQVSVRLDGEPDDVSGSAGNVRLYESAFDYDPMNRLTATTVEFFDTDTQNQLPGGQLPGKSISTIEYSDCSQVTRNVDDNGHQALKTYDTVNRLNAVTDDKGSSINYAYDANSNVTSMTEIEKSDLLNPDESFVTSCAYDNLDRRTQTTDNAGNVSNSAFDSRNNQTVLSDALSNETRYAYDGINRQTRAILDLDGDGADGDGTDITTTQSWDDSSRLVGQTDDNGNTTACSFDALDRITVKSHADATVHVYAYDVHNNMTSTIDANGSVTTCLYDLLDRATGRAISPGSGVSNDTTFENYTYDGLSRFVQVEDDDSVVTRSYDSLSRVTSETLNGQATTCTYDGVGNQTQCAYPGGRTITCTFDQLDRKQTISDGGGSIAAYDYIGPGRVERREFGNGTRTDYQYDGILPNPTGDFGVKKIVGTTHSVIAGGALIDQRTYTWDAMYNKTQRKDTRIGGPRLTHDYSYDAIYRLTGTTATNAFSIVSRNTSYDHDGVGNRTQVTGLPDAGLYQMDATLPERGDRQVNQYTNTPTDQREHDANGNFVSSFTCLQGDVNGDLALDDLDAPPFAALLLAGGPVACEADLNEDGNLDGLDVQAFVDRLLGTTSATPDYQIMYDYRNQMVEYSDPVTGQRHTYAYDALGRRIVRIEDADAVAGGPTQTRYFYDGWQVIEEQDQLGATQATYVYGLYVDEVLNMQRGGNDFYMHTDDLFNVMAVTTAAGAVVERYEYQDYGDPEFMDGGGGALAESAINNPYLFNGRRYDPETAWYYYRTRYLDPRSGRFTTRDTIGVWGDAHNIGNGYAYVGNAPTTFLDPYGKGVDADAVGDSILRALRGAGGSTANRMCGKIVNAKLLSFTRDIGILVATTPLKVVAGGGFFGETAKGIADTIGKIEDAKDKVDRMTKAINDALGKDKIKVVTQKRMFGAAPCSCSMTLLLKPDGEYTAFFKAIEGTKSKWDDCCAPYTITHFRVTGTAKMVDKPGRYSKVLHVKSTVQEADKVQSHLR